MDKEFFNSSEYNNKYDEYKKFSAEEYRLPLEYSKNGKEYDKTKEINNFEPKPEEKDNKPDTSLREKLKEKLAQTATNASTHLSTTIATTAITGTVAAATVFTPLGALPPTIEINEIVTGENSVYYSITVDDLDEKYNYSINIENFKQQFSFPLVEGVNENIVEGLLPGYEYTISMVGTDDNNVKVEYKKQKFYTLKEKLPDINFEFTKHPQYYRGYSLEFNIDISDKKNDFEGFVLNVTNNDKLYLTANAKNNKITGMLDQVPSGKVNFDVFGIINNKQVFIDSKEYFVENPSYSITLGNSYRFDKNGEIQIPYTINANEMADKVIGKINFNIDYNNGISSPPEEVYNVKANEENWLTLTETPKGAKTVSISPELLVTGGVDGNPSELLDTVHFALPYKLEVVSKQVYLNKLNTAEKTLTVNFGMHDEANTKLFVSKNSGTATEVLGGTYEINIEPSDTNIDLAYYKQYADGTKSAVNNINIPVIAIPSYNFNYQSQMYKVFYTYNEDRTYNAYFDMRSASGDPALSNPDLYYNISLMDNNGNVKKYRFTEDIAVIKNLSSRYSITYEVCKDIGDITYMFQKTSISGSIPMDASTSSIDARLYTDTSNSNQILTISLDSNVAMYDFTNANITLNNGEVRQISEKDFTVDELGNYHFSMPVNNEVTSAIFVVNICDKKFEYEQFNNMGLIVGSPYTKIIKDIVSGPITA